MYEESFFKFPINYLSFFIFQEGDNNKWKNESFKILAGSKMSLFEISNETHNHKNVGFITMDLAKENSV